MPGTMSCFSGGKWCLRNKWSLSPSTFLLCLPVLCQADRAQEQWGGSCFDSYWRLQHTAGSAKGQGDTGANGSSAQGERWIVKWFESRWNCLRIPCKAFPSSTPTARRPHKSISVVSSVMEMEPPGLGFFCWDTVTLSKLLRESKSLTAIFCHPETRPQGLRSNVGSVACWSPSVWALWPFPQDADFFLLVIYLYYAFIWPEKCIFSFSSKFSFSLSKLCITHSCYK